MNFSGTPKSEDVKINEIKKTKNLEVDFCFVLSDLLATTPRALRAIQLILNEGYSVCLIYNRRIKHADDYNEILLKMLASPKFYAKGIEWRKNTPRVLIFKMIRKLGFKLYKTFRFKNPLLLQLSYDFTTFWQKYQCKYIKAKIYAGHRPSTLPIITYLANKYNGVAWFDIEDYHFEESVDSDVNQFMHDFIPLFPVKHYTNASSLIGSAYTKKLNQSDPGLEILNAPLHENFNLNDQEKDPDTFYIIWFSQFVTFNRGLELFFKALESHRISENIVINLIGLADPMFEDYIKRLNLKNIKVIFHGFKQENEILELALKSDIGLALELPTVDKSRNMAVTNKILTYAVCGNYIIATRTAGQVYFMKKIPENGILVDPKIKAFEELFLNLDIIKLSQIRAMRQNRIINARKISWQIQENKLKGFFKNLIASQ